MAGNGLPNQTPLVSQPPTRAAEDNGIFNMFSNIGDIIAKTVNSLTPAADTVFRYQLARSQLRQTNALALDGSYPQDGNQNGLFAGGLSNGNNQTLLVIAGIAALAVGVIVLAK